MFINKFLLAVFLLAPSLVFARPTITKCLYDDKGLEITVDGGRLFFYHGRTGSNCPYWTWNNWFGYGPKTNYQCEYEENVIRLTVYNKGDEIKGEVWAILYGEEHNFSCSSVTREDKISDPHFDPLIQKFVAQGKKYLGDDFELGDIPINFLGQPSSNIAASCYNKGIHPQVVVNRNWWETVDALGHEIVISNLLGHCSLNRAKSDNPYSIMNPNSLLFLRQVKMDSRRYFLIILNAYYEELFTGSDTALKKAIEDYNTFQNSL